MLPFRKILFPVDYSDPCQAVVPYVKDMLTHFPSELTVLHAYAAEALADSTLALADPQLPVEVRAIEEQRLREFALKMFPGRHVESIVELGEPGTVIHRLVQHQGVDLVMLPTHGRGPLRRFLLGSVAAKVLHDVSAAVWTGTGSALTEHSTVIPYKSVLCSIDESDETEAVLKGAASFTAAYHAQLSLVRVVETPPPAMEIDFSGYRKDIINAAQTEVRELLGKLKIDAPYHVVDARIPEGVRQEAVRRKADLVVTGRGRAQGALSRTWSHVYPIVRESPCPVLSF